MLMCTVFQALAAYEARRVALLKLGHELARVERELANSSIPPNAESTNRVVKMQAWLRLTDADINTPAAAINVCLTHQHAVLHVRAVFADNLYWCMLLAGKAW
jgi:hypothetical protein